MDLAARTASALARLDLERGADRGWIARYQRLRRLGRIADEAYFETIGRDDLP
jgi:hypothetical protein